MTELGFRRSPGRASPRARGAAMFGTRGWNPAPPREGAPTLPSKRRRSDRRIASRGGTAPASRFAKPVDSSGRPAPASAAGAGARRVVRSRRRRFTQSSAARRAAPGEPSRRLTEEAPLIDSQIEKRLELRGVLDQRRRVQRGPPRGPDALRRSSRRSRRGARGGGSGVLRPRGGSRRDAGGSGV
jgi:hypothetical protein